MESKFYGLKCITNLFVGNGDNSYGIIDNQVEKDPILETPIIPSSSLKGSLRDFFENNSDNNIKITEIFGSDAKETKNTNSGSYSFFTAQLLFRPMRVSDGNFTYCLVTTVDLLEKMIQMVSDLNGDLPCDMLKAIKKVKEKMNNLKDKYGISNKDISVEGYDLEYCKEDVNKDVNKAIDLLLNIFEKFNLKNGVPIVILKPEIFKEIDLPIVARNQLEDGLSNNLWYEEIVPHESIFYFAVMYPDNNDSFKKFDEELRSNIIRFGGGASIGYGYCKIEEYTINK
ncbi:type III-B CRISPR module RAMP protein Cmr4 [Parvimonas micra]|uniref:type III-B CRISPR module RAMP protein Cmr4 n=1 Tax=Parvimonas micra TaxID=33033 RepID=UPI000E51B48E|nr:type III-B CRISPR module RAMP protein Cmr4 [Parvimonas micra]AXU10577.1 type III-B CRISPR module RAMP protein Cmr4 [Parvimonas micra]